MIGASGVASLGLLSFPFTANDIVTSLSLSVPEVMPRARATSPQGPPAPIELRAPRWPTTRVAPRGRRR